MSRPQLSLVIGALDEEHRVGGTLQELRAWLSKQGLLETTEVVVVTADARDNTHQVVAKELQYFPLQQHVRPGRRVGKGRDIALGMLHARGDIRIFMDADLATPLHHLPRVLAELQKQPNALVIGSRNVHRIHRGLRWLMSWGGNLLFKLSTGLYVTDTQCGLKGMSAHTAKLLFHRLRIQKWGFDMELIAIAHANHLPVVELSIADWQDVAGSTVEQGLTGVAKAAVHSLHDLARISYRNFRGQYRLDLDEDIDE